LLNSLLLWTIEHAGPWLMRLFGMTLRFRENPLARASRLHPKKSQGIYAFWHAHQLGCCLFYHDIPIHIMISRSRDGEYVARLAQGLGFRPVRGSSSRGGAEASLAMLQAARQGHVLAITPDGPRGPRHQSHPGFHLLARKTGLPVHPVAIGFSDWWELRSWDRFRVPKPFSRAVAYVGEAVPMPGGDSPEDAKEARRRLDEALNRAEDEADRLAAEWSRHCGGRPRRPAL